MAAVIGNGLEWYNFMLYGVFAAIIAKLYFPHRECFDLAAAVARHVLPSGSSCARSVPPCWDAYSDQERAQGGTVADHHADVHRHRDDRAYADLSRRSALPRRCC